MFHSLHGDTYLKTWLRVHSLGLMQPEEQSDCKNDAAHTSVSNPSWRNLHKCHLLAKVNKSPLSPLTPSTHLIGRAQPGGICWAWNWFTGYFHGKMLFLFCFFSFWWRMLRVREANKAIRSNQKFRPLTPELTAEATNTLINICTAVNDGLSELPSSPCSWRNLYISSV